MDNVGQSILCVIQISLRLLKQHSFSPPPPPPKKKKPPQLTLNWYNLTLRWSLSLHETILGVKYGGEILEQFLCIHAPDLGD